MVKKETEDFEEDEDDDDFEDEIEDEETPKKKGKVKRGKDWIIQHSPESFAVINPETKEILAQAQTPELLSLQLQLISAQKSSEASKQTE